MAKVPTEIRSRARLFTIKAIAVLIEIMNDRRIPANVRVAAAEALLNRGLGTAVDRKRFALIEQEFYVYSVHQEGRLVYVGKGSGPRHAVSAPRPGGKSRIRAFFKHEGAALAFERRLIKRFKPILNSVFSERPRLRTVA